MDKDFSVTDWERRPERFVSLEQVQSSCSAKLATQLADIDFEKLSESKRSEWVEHAIACPTCKRLILQHKRVKSIFETLSCSERYPDEPELTFPLHLLRVQTEEHA